MVDQQFRDLLVGIEERFPFVSIVVARHRVVCEVQVQAENPGRDEIKIRLESTVLIVGHLQPI